MKKIEIDIVTEGNARCSVQGIYLQEGDLFICAGQLLVMTELYHDIEIHEGYIIENLFSEFITHMPLVCVELIFEADNGILLAERNIDHRCGSGLVAGCTKGSG